jgi:hypothetical protein
MAISLDIPRPDDKAFQDTLSLYTKQTADIINTKEGALYNKIEQANYRRTYDLVELNAGVAIPPGFTNIALTGPNLINGVLVPTNGYGAATIAGPQYLFFNSNVIEVRFDNTVPTAQVIRIGNASGFALTQMYFVFEYLKTA